jgi:hypothetical protein
MSKQYWDGVSYRVHQLPPAGRTPRQRPKKNGIRLRPPEPERVWINPRGSTLPRDGTVPIYEHSAYKPPRKLSALEVAQHLRQQAAKSKQVWPLA